MSDVFKMPDPVPGDPDQSPEFHIVVEHDGQFICDDPGVKVHLRPGFSIVSVLQEETYLFSVVCAGNVDDAELSITAKVPIVLFPPEITPVRVFVKRGFLPELPTTVWLVVETVDEDGDAGAIVSELLERTARATHAMAGRA